MQPGSSITLQKTVQFHRQPVLNCRFTAGFAVGLPQQAKTCCNEKMKVHAAPLLATAVAHLLTAGAVHAHQPPEPVEALATEFLHAQASGLPGDISIEVGQLDRANQLPPCASLQPFLPPGTRAWGQISVGVRCDSPVVWTVYLPARVSAVTDYLVAARPIRPGQIIGPEDLRLERGDLAAQPPGALTDMARAIGHHARFAVGAGNTLRAEMLRLPPAVQQGQTVKVIGSGAGFRVSNEGRALNRAGEGESVRVRLPNGQVVTGVARAEGVVEIRF